MQFIQKELAIVGTLAINKSVYYYCMGHVVLE